VGAPHKAQSMNARMLAIAASVLLLGAGYHLYIPATISAAAQRDLREFISGTDIGRLPAPGDIAMWKREQAQTNAHGALAVVHTARRLDLTITPQRLGGVPVLQILPRGWKPDPRVVIYFHGGAYTLFSAQTMITMPAELSRVTGERVISVDYTLAPEAKWNAIQQQAIAVVEAVRAQGSAMDQIALMGDSAGGNLAVETVLNLRDRRIGMPAAALLLSPWVDLTDRGDTMHTLEWQDPILFYDHSLQNAALAYAGGLPLTDPRISPIYADFSKGFPPSLIQDGTKDILLSGSVRLYRALEDANARPVLDLYEGMWHDFQSWNTPESQIAYQEMARFLRLYQRRNTRVVEKDDLPARARLAQHYRGDRLKGALQRAVRHLDRG
jgi:monoterpene epsilon-lactone hydrolase